MTSPSRHQTHDRLLNRVRLTERRLSRLQTELGADDELKESELSERVDHLTARCSELMVELRDWTEVEIGMLTAVEDLAAAVDTVETDLTAERAVEPVDYEEAMDRQVRLWRTRIDRLRLHRELASMEARDELEILADRLEDARATVLDDLQNIVGDTRSAVVDLRSGAERVLTDVRRTVEHVAESLTSNRK